MSKQTEGNFRTFGPTMLGIIFAVLQGFTVYFTKNVEASISKLDAKLDHTWEIALVTKTELSSLKTLFEVQKGEISQLELELNDLRRAFHEEVIKPPR